MGSSAIKLESSGDLTARNARAAERQRLASQPKRRGRPRKFHAEDGAGPGTLSESIGARIAAARKARSLTQQQLGALIEKSRATIIYYEAGQIEPPVSQIVRLAEALGVASEYLAFGRSAIAGLTGETAEAVPLLEVRLTEGEAIIGASAISRQLATDYGIEEGARAYLLPHSAPAFGFQAGDRLIVNPVEDFAGEHRLYLLRTRHGAEIVRLMPALSPGNLINLNGSQGQSYTVDPAALSLIGVVAAVIQRS